MTCILHFSCYSEVARLQCTKKRFGSSSDANEPRSFAICDAAVINKSFVICLGLQVNIVMVSQLCIIVSFHKLSSSSCINRPNYRQYASVFRITENMLL
jgi:hypothetical protein